MNDLTYCRSEQKTILFDSGGMFYAMCSSYHFLSALQ